jgi:hypothetical protein
MAILPHISEQVSASLAQRQTTDFWIILMLSVEYAVILEVDQTFRANSKTTHIQFHLPLCELSTLTLKATLSISGLSAYSEQMFGMSGQLESRVCVIRAFKVEVDDTL